MTAELRERTEVEAPTYQDTIWVNWEGTLNSKNFLAGSGERAMTDYVTPGYHALIRDGVIINNPCDYTVESYEMVNNDNIYLSWYYHTTPDEWTRWYSGNVTVRYIAVFGFYLMDVNTAPVSTFDSKAQAKTFCLANVDSTPYEFFEDLAELRETLLFLRNPLRGIADLAKAYKNRLRQLRRKRWTYKYDEAKAYANLWNQYRFALAPLIRSIMNAAEAWDNRDSLKRPERRSAHGFSKTSETEDEFYWNRQPNAQQTRYRKVCSNDVEVHATIYYEVSNPVVDWKFALGLRAKDIPKVLWEVLPLSFMVDRLVNVRNSISALTNLFDPSVTFLAASVTNRNLLEHTVSMDYLYWSTGHYIFAISNPDAVKWTTFSYKREVWVPQFADALPPITWRGLTADITKTTDLIALSLSRLL